METVINNLFLTHLAQAEGGGGSFMLTMGLMLGAMYFLMIAPQRKKQKLHKQMIESLGKGDDVMTASGIFGTITSVKEDRFTVKIADGVKIEIQKGFVQAKMSDEAASTEAK